MGNLITNCENCFEAKDLDPRKSSLNYKYQDGKPKDSDMKTDLYRTDKEKKVQTGSDKTPNDEGQKHKLSSRSANSSKGESNGKDKVDKGHHKLTIEDFRLIRVLGRGSFGKVYLVQKKDNKKYYALKTLKKEEILSRNQIDNALTEKNVLQSAFHPFVVRLRFSFQNESTLYLVMDYLSGGELFTHLKKKGRFDEESSRFYAAEVVLALEYLHDKLDIIYRDLKPENILLDNTGHLKITDFGLSKATKKTFSFCGTPEYLAPEILLGSGHNKSVDWWSLGCLIYEMLAGYPPFSSKNRKQLYNDILKQQPIMPSHFSNGAREILSKLMIRDPNLRLGSKGAQEIKEHPFFEGVKWDDVLNRKCGRPPILPIVTKPEDVRNFDRQYVNEPVIETPVTNPGVLQDQRNEFKNFTYVQGNDMMHQEDEDKQHLVNKNH
jgi:serine/threonine protein kinase